jgi:hypothetical protein
MKELLENLKGFIQANIDLVKLEVQEKIDQAIKVGIKYIGLVIFGVLSILFIIITTALLLGSLLHNYSLGFGIITFLLILITAIFYYLINKKTE